MNKKLEELEQKIEREKQRLEQLQVKKKAEIAKEKERERKRETRAKIIIGGYVLERLLCNKSEQSENFLQSILSTVKRDADVDLLREVVRKRQA